MSHCECTAHLGAERVCWARHAVLHAPWVELAWGHSGAWERQQEGATLEFSLYTLYSMFIIYAYCTHIP